MSEFEEIDIIVLTDEDGNEEQFELLSGIEHEGRAFVVLQDPEEEDCVIIMEEIALNEEESNYIMVEDDDLCEAVFQKFAAEFED